MNTDAEKYFKINGTSRINDNSYPILNTLLSIGFLSGSFAFNIATADSDYDICYDITRRDEIEEIIEPIINNKEESNYFSGYTVRENFIDINLIPLHPHEYSCWYLATKAMMAISQELPIYNKIHRDSIFQGMVQHFKGTIPILGDYSTINKRIFGVPSLKKYIDLKNKIDIPPSKELCF